MVSSFPLPSWQNSNPCNGIQQAEFLPAFSATTLQYSSHTLRIKLRCFSPQHLKHFSVFSLFTVNSVQNTILSFLGPLTHTYILLYFSSYPTHHPGSLDAWNSPDLQPKLGASLQSFLYLSATTPNTQGVCVWGWLAWFGFCFFERVSPWVLDVLGLKVCKLCPKIAMQARLRD